MKKAIFLITFLLLPISLYANEEVVLLDQKKTIKELRENIEELDRAKSDLILKIEDFSVNQTIKSFLKSDLSDEEFKTIENIVLSYNNQKNEIEEQLVEVSKKLLSTDEINFELSELRKNFYIELLDFVDINKYSSYLYYINEQTDSYMEEKEIDADIVRKSEIVSTKVANIEEKIKEHKSYLADTIQELINEKIDERIEMLENDTNFSKLSNEEKLLVIDRILAKTNEMLLNLNIENKSGLLSSNLTANNETKIEICNLMLKKFQKFKEGL